MPVTAALLQEEVDEMEAWAEVLERMTHHQRMPISQACQKLTDFSKGQSDPLLNPTSANPFLKKAGGKKKTCGCF